MSLIRRLKPMAGIRLRTLLCLALLPLSACSCEDEPINMIVAGTCEPSFECPRGYQYRRGECRAARCQADSDCCPGQVCNVGAGFCADQYTACSSDSQCTEIPGQKCIDFRGGQFCGYPNKGNVLSTAGTQGCATNDDCGSGRSCVGNRCLAFAPCDGGCEGTQVCDIDSNTCFDEPTCEVSCGDGQIRVVKDPDTMSGPLCCLVECTCATLPPVQPGQYGWFAALATSENGAFVATYDPVYGDLVVVEFDATGKEIAHTYVDGFPNSGPVAGNPQGPRAGRSAPGDDVGEHTSLVIDNAGSLHVAYYDRTNGDLRYANYTANTWATSVVDSEGDVGMYTSIAIGPDGNPRIAYMLVEGTLPGKTGNQTALKYAEASTNLPGAASDWQIQVVESKDKAPPICGGGCGSNEVCVDLGMGPACTPEAMGCMMCEDSQACVMGGMGAECADEIPTVALDDLIEGTGLFTSLVLSSTGTPMIGYYDRVEGDLRSATGIAPGRFKRQTLDGNDPMSPSDVGQHLSMALDPNGELGLAYFDATKDDLVYLNTGTMQREIVDDGLTPPNVRVVGADASLIFDSAGNPAVAYQDATNIDLVYARRFGSPPMWSTEVLQGGSPAQGTPGTAAGFYATQGRQNDSAFVGNVEVSFDQESNLLLDLKVLVKPLN